KIPGWHTDCSYLTGRNWRLSMTVTFCADGVDWRTLAEAVRSERGPLRLIELVAELNRALRRARQGAPQHETTRVSEENHNRLLSDQTSGGKNAPFSRTVSTALSKS